MQATEPTSEGEELYLGDDEDASLARVRMILRKRYAEIESKKLERVVVVLDTKEVPPAERKQGNKALGPVGKPLKKTPNNSSVSRPTTKRTGPTKNTSLSARDRLAHRLKAQKKGKTIDQRACENTIALVYIDIL